MKAIVFDYDNSLYSHIIKGIPEQTKKAILLLKEKGFVVCLNTSRGKDELTTIDPFVRQEFDYILCNTGAMLTKNEEIIYCKELEYEKVKPLIEKYQDQNITIRYTDLNGNQYFVDEIKDEFFLKLFSSWTLKDLIYKPYEDERLCELTLAGLSDEQNKTAIAFLKNFGVNYTSFGNSIVINALGINKGYGVKQLSSIYNIPLDDIITIGDDENDIEMLKITKYSICVMNPFSEKVKEHSNYQMKKTIEEGGVFEILQELGFINT